MPLEYNVGEEEDVKEKEYLNKVVVGLKELEAHKLITVRTPLMVYGGKSLKDQFIEDVAKTYKAYRDDGYSKYESIKYAFEDVLKDYSEMTPLSEKSAKLNEKGGSIFHKMTLKEAAEKFLP